jgi:hypothetical protein
VTKNKRGKQSKQDRTGEMQESTGETILGELGQGHSGSSPVFPRYYGGNQGAKQARGKHRNQKGKAQKKGATNRQNNFPLGIGPHKN